MTPAEIVVAVAAGVSRLATGGLTDAEISAEASRLAHLYAEPTDVRHPFAPLGDQPLRTRDDLRRHFAAIPAQLRGVTRFEPVGQVHRTTDPELVIYEFSYVGVAQDRPFDIPCLFVTRVRDGQIVESRDYAHHVAQARAFGHLQALIGALAAEDG
ncbi:nuclear transport factor 2 family protein [Actinoplanes sp. NPDC051411]|uniref:nuclear transport factor 2 family protein n=1 Tax=Actinoplanes sp. NPDC051411 TaxID=3155522 RepID=UPI003448EECD